MKKLIAVLVVPSTVWGLTTAMATTAATMHVAQANRSHPTAQAVAYSRVYYVCYRRAGFYSHYHHHGAYYHKRYWRRGTIHARLADILAAIIAGIRLASTISYSSARKALRACHYRRG